MFISNEGRTALAKRAGFQRLLVVTLHRGHTYKSLDDVKAELSSKVMELAPAGLGKVQVLKQNIIENLSEYSKKNYDNKFQFRMRVNRSRIFCSWSHTMM